MSSRSFSHLPAASGPELLRRFAEAGDQRAFEKVVQSQGGWMTAAAVRLTGDAALAQEVVQDCFTLLARKLPQFPTEAAMGAWLHRTVVLMARNQLAKRQRLQRKHLRFSWQNVSGVPVVHSAGMAASGGLPEESLMLLDTLIGALPEAERELIIGRYYNKLSWSSLAAMQGTSAEAARKRTERILRRFEDVFQSRGLRHCSASLALILTESSRMTLSPAQAGALAANSAAGCGQLSGLTLFTHTLAMISTTKSIVLTAVLCGLGFSVPIVMLSQDSDLKERQAASRLEDREAELKELRMKLAALQGRGQDTPSAFMRNPEGGPADTIRIPGASKALGAVGAKMAGVAEGAAGPAEVVNRALTEAVGAVMEEPDHDRRVAGLQFLLQWLRPVDVDAVRGVLNSSQKPGVPYVDETNALRERWAQMDGRAAMEDYVEGNTTKAYNRLHAAAVRGWASTDPEGLMEWMRALPPECDWKEKAAGDILRGLRQGDPAKATEFLLKSGAPMLEAGIPAVAQRVLQEQGTEGLSKWLKALPVNERTDKARGGVAFQLLESQAFAGAQAAVDSLKSFDHESWGGDQLASRLGSRFGMASPEKAFAMLDLLPTDSSLAKSLSSSLFSSLARAQPNVVATWLNENPASTYADLAAGTLAMNVQKSDPEAAQAWAGKIRNEKTRNGVLWKLAQSKPAEAK